MTRESCFKTLLVCFWLLLPTINFAQQPGENINARLVFLGTTHDSSQSVWLSVTTAGAFALEAQGQQLVDSWNMLRRGIHLSLSPFVSQGNGGTHFLINRINNRILDSQNQRGGIVFPPLPAEPPNVMPPIVVFPEHPIIIPPGATRPQVPPTGSNVPASASEPTDQSNNNLQTPLTQASEIGNKYAWDVWSDNYYFNSTDGRNDLDTKGVTTNFVTA